MWLLNNDIWKGLNIESSFEIVIQKWQLMERKVDSFNFDVSSSLELR
jgi:hypothetical protein